MGCSDEDLHSTSTIVHSSLLRCPIRSKMIAVSPAISGGRQTSPRCCSAIGQPFRPPTLPHIHRKRSRCAVKRAQLSTAAASGSRGAAPAPPAPATAPERSLTERMFEQMERNSAAGEQGRSTEQYQRLWASPASQFGDEAALRQLGSSFFTPRGAPLTGITPDPSESRPFAPLGGLALQPWERVAPPLWRRCAAPTPPGSQCAPARSGAPAPSLYSQRRSRWGCLRMWTSQSAAGCWASSSPARCSCEVGLPGWAGMHPSSRLTRAHAPQYGDHAYRQRCALLARSCDAPAASLMPALPCARLPPPQAYG